MPYRARRACAKVTPSGLCPHLQPCPVHRRKPWAHAEPSRQARGYDAEYERNRKIVLAEEKDCWLCGGAGLTDDQADHVRPGGGSTRSNLRRAHKTCNERRGSRLGRSVQLGPVIRKCGHGPTT